MAPAVCSPRMARGFARGLCLAASAVLLLSASAGAKTYKVTTTADHRPKRCSASDCTLREAVRASNKHAGLDKIQLAKSKKPYRLTRDGSGEDKARKGDLDLRDTDGVTIKGKKPRRAVIQQTTEDRVLDVPQATDGFVTLSKVTVTGGDIDEFATDGGGIRTAGLLRVSRSVIKGNQATGTGAGGGGIGTTGGDAATSQLIMRRSTVSGNTSVSTGGGIDLVGIDFDVEIEASTISGNDGSRGGGIWTNPDEGMVTIVNSTIVNNTAVAPDPGTAPADGGGIYIVDLLADNVGPLFRIEMTTIAGNESLPGRDANFKASYPIQLQNTLIADPVGGQNCDADVDSHGYNLDEGTTCDLDQGTDEENADPVLGTLRKNGGPTRTMALGLGSDAVAEGDCTPSFALPGFDLTVDQRGVSRPQPAGGDCDIGAWEGNPVLQLP
jgi:CSLREA domain-containing protein